MGTLAEISDYRIIIWLQMPMQIFLNSKSFPLQIQTPISATTVSGGPFEGDIDESDFAVNLFTRTVKFLCSA